MGGEEGKRNPRREATPKILWEYLWEERRERNPHVKERWCVGRKEGRAWRLQWLFVGPRFFFMEAVGWGQWTVATVDLARRGDSGERNGATEVR